MNNLLSIAAVMLFVHASQAQWLPDAGLTADVSFSATTLNNARSMAASGDEVHVAWFDERDGNEEIYYKRSTDSGLTWSDDARLTTNTAGSIFPSIAVSGAQVHVVWEEYRNGNAEIYYKGSQDGGTTWGEDIRLTNNWATSFSPSVSASGEVVSVVWFDARNGNHEIYYKRSTDAGLSWGADTRLTNNSAASTFAGVTSSGSQVHVVWEEYRDGPCAEIYYKRSPDAGLSWGPDIRLTNNPAMSLSPSVSASGQHLHVVWFDQRDGNWEIYDKSSAVGGLNWGADTRLTNDAASSQYPTVAVSLANVHVVWGEERDGNLEIYYKRSTDGGANWEPDQRLTVDDFRSVDPSVAAVGSTVHVAWTDSRDGFPAGVYNGNYEIYYKRNPTGNSPGGGSFANRFDLLAAIRDVVGPP